MHVIAAKALCFKEAMKPEFKSYQNQVRKNAAAMAATFNELGYKLTSGGTDNHLLLIDLRENHPDLTGKQAQIALDKAHITTNRNTVPGETRSPFQTSGVRIGTPACTSRGMVEADFQKIARAIDRVLSDVENPTAIEEARQVALQLTEAHPLPY